MGQLPLINMTHATTPEWAVVGRSEAAQAAGMALPVPFIERSSQGSSVLVVNDEATSRALVESIPEASGHRVTAVDSAVAAAAAIDRNTPDVIVVDYSMPDMDGVELTRAIRADPRLAGVSIVMVTGRHQVADKLAGSGQPAAIDIISVAIGIAATTAGTDATAEDLIARASGAKHAAKANPGSGIFVDRRAQS